MFSHLVCDLGSYYDCTQFRQKHVVPSIFFICYVLKNCNWGNHAHLSDTDIWILKKFQTFKTCNHNFFFFLYLVCTFNTSTIPFMVKKTYFILICYIWTIPYNFFSNTIFFSVCCCDYITCFRQLPGILSWVFQHLLFACNIKI